MKYIVLLSPIKLKNLHDQQLVSKDEKTEELVELEISFKEFILGRLHDPKFATSMEKIQSVWQIKEALKEGEERGYLALETSDWNNLVEVVKKPSESHPYNPLLAYNLIPFMRAVVNASDTRPE